MLISSCLLTDFSLDMCFFAMIQNIFQGALQSDLKDHTLFKSPKSRIHGPAEAFKCAREHSTSLYKVPKRQIQPTVNLGYLYF